MWQGLMYKHWQAHPAGGVGAALWSSWALPKESGDFGDCYWSQTSLAMGLSQAEGDSSAHHSWVWSSSSLSWGYPARAFLSRDLFLQRNLGPNWRSHNWDLVIPSSPAQGTPDGLLVSVPSPADWSPYF